MIEFLKESTFAVNEVIHRAWQILKRSYFIIGSLCFLMFLTLSFSGVLASYFQGSSPAIRYPMFLIFVVIFCGFQLTLFSYTLKQIDDKNSFTEEFLKTKMFENIKLILLLIGTAFLGTLLLALIVFFSGWSLNILLSPIIVAACIVSLVLFRKKLFPLVLVIRDNWPSRAQMTNFLAATVCFSALVLLTFLVIAAIFFPIVLFDETKMNAVVGSAFLVGVVVSIIVAIRISFFPLFIMDRDFSPFKSLRFSLAITRGNFTRLLLILFFLLICPFLALYFGNKQIWYAVNLIFAINSFVVVPLSSVITVAAYRQMTSDYEGDDDPDVIHNLL